MSQYEEFMLPVRFFTQNFIFSCWILATYKTETVPRLGQKSNAELTYSILAAISFKIVSLGMYTAITLFFPHFKSTVEVIFLNAAEYHL
jgi:hypothetical protein